MQGRWMYLVAIIDWYSRKIVGYELSQTMNKEFVIKAVVDAVNKHGAPIILNSDQGSQFTSPDYIDTLKGYGIKISMDGKGRALDNAITERFWRTIKLGRVSPLSLRYCRSSSTPIPSIPCDPFVGFDSFERFVHIVSANDFLKQPFLRQGCVGVVGFSYPRRTVHSRISFVFRTILLR
jgi:transposase InsO family protein